MIYVKVMFAIIVWGTSFVFTKTALAEMSVMSLVFARCFLGSLVMLLFSRRFGWLKKFTAKDWLRITIIAGLGVVFQQLLQGYAMLHTSSNHAGWLIGATPLAVAALLTLVFKEKIGRLRLAGFGLGFIGTVLVVASRQSVGGVVTPTGFGDAIFLISCVTWALYVILLNRWFSKYSQADVTMLTMALSCVILIVPGLIDGMPAQVMRLTPMGIWSVCYLGVLSSGVAYTFWNMGVEKLGPAAVSSFIYFESFAAMAAGKLILNESVSPYAVVGGVLIMGGVYWINGGRAGAGPLKKLYYGLSSIMRQ